ncbi:MAG: hypothetical protein GW762_03640 [Candidatus Pacebacteria bacterium]|nr:hypothetical protein [Candidatus Paceibacterota bacterium]
MLLADPTTSWGRPSGTMTPKLSTGGNDNKEGKQLVLTVSASPTNHTAKKEDQAASRGENMATLSENRTASFDSECSHKNQDSPGPLYQDSPGPAFVAMMGDFGDDDLMNESSSSCHEYHSSVASFNLLPLLDGDDRASPPLIPYLGKSRQPSWEMADEGAAPNNESDNNGLKKGTRCIVSVGTSFSNSMLRYSNLLPSLPLFLLK